MLFFFLQGKVLEKNNNFKHVITLKISEIWIHGKRVPANLNDFTHIQKLKDFNITKIFTELYKTATNFATQESDQTNEI